MTQTHAHPSSPGDAADGSVRVVLDDASKAWRILSGKVDLFYVCEAFGGGGRLHPLARIEAGGVLVGMDTSAWPVGVKVLGIGVIGTELAPLADLYASEDPALLDGLAQWFVSLTGGLQIGALPRNHLQMKPGAGQALPEGRVVTAPHAPVWLTSSDGGRLQRPLLGPSQDTFHLVTRTYWGVVQRAGSFDVLDLAELQRRGLLEPAVAGFHAGLGGGLTAIRKRESEQEQVRFETRTVHDEAMLQEAVNGFSQVLGGKTAAASGRKPLDPIYTLCDLVASAGGITLNPEARNKYQFEASPSLAILRASGVRQRTVMLTGTWWLEDNGPLFGCIEADTQPIALLPRDGKAYDMVTGDGTVTPVTEAVAATIRPRASMFYRPLPSGVLTLVDLLRYAAGGLGKDVRMVVAMGVLIGVMGLVIPFATGLIFDQVIPKAAFGDMTFIAIGLVATVLGLLLFTLAQSFALVRLEGKVESALQAAVWDRILKLPVPFFRDYVAGDLNQRIMSIESMRAALSGPVIMGLISSSAGLIYFFQFFYFSWELAVVGGLLGLCALIPLSMGLINISLNRRIQQADGRLSGLVLQLLLGLSKIRNAGAEERAFSRWAEQFAAFKKLTHQSGMVQNVVTVWNTAFLIGSTIAVFATVFYVNAEEEVIGVGAFVAFQAAFGLFLGGLMSLSDSLVKLVSLVPLYERARPILEAVPESEGLSTQPGELTGALEVDNLSFRYEEGAPLVLDNVSFQVEPGEFVAMVGPSGSGKSTLLRMLLGFEAPHAGAVYYDGLELAGLDVASVRRQIGVVLQNSELIPGSILENLVGSMPLTVDDAWEAAAMAGFSDDVRDMPMGMHTLISESGGSLSGGQVQRLMIARALIGKPRILFFDEATSALDNATQAAVTASLDRLRVTRIVIAHRLSTVMNADKILVMKAGRIVEAGTYKELMDRKGIFFQLADRQIA